MWKAAILLCATALSAKAQPAPVWAKPDLFWYRKTTAAGFVYTQVDLKSGSQSPLFDHGRLAAELSAKSEMSFRAATLPFDGPDAHFVVRFDGGNTMNASTMALEFMLRGELWHCEMQAEWDWGKATDYDCASRGAYDRVEEPLSDVAPRVSPDGKWEALVVNNNVVLRRAGSAATTVLSKDGTAAFSYYAGSLSWSDDSKTVSAYRVDSAIWTRDVGSNVRAQVARGEWPVR